MKGFQKVSQVLSAAAVLLGSAGYASAQWEQWGGPNRDFSNSARGLAKSWPEDGPNKLWSRDLGPGYSSILVDVDTLFTMYRDGDQEVVIALDRGTGKTKWEHKYNAPVPEDMETRFGEGPNATPLVHDGRLYAVGVAGDVICLDRKTGKPVWTHNLVKEFKADTPEFGFSSSPLLYDGKLIVAGGGEGSAVVAFDADTGDVKWKKHSFGNIYSSPIVVRANGSKDIVLLADTQVVGMDPDTGELRWSFPHENQWKTNIATPMLVGDGLIFVTSGGEAGSRALRLTGSEGKTKPEEVWANRKVGIGQSNIVRAGNILYASTGHNPTFITAVDTKTGEVLWQERGFNRATLNYADGKLIILDDEGKLALATPTDSGLEVHSRAEIGDKRSWTVPTLVGKTLYIRDAEKIMALDLG